MKFLKISVNVLLLNSFAPIHFLSFLFMLVWALWSYLSKTLNWCEALCGASWWSADLQLAFSLENPQICICGDLSSMVQSLQKSPSSILPGATYLVSICTGAQLGRDYGGQYIKFLPITLYTWYNSLPFPPTFCCICSPRAFLFRFLQKKKLLVFSWIRKFG